MKKLLYVSAIVAVMALPAAPALAAGGDKEQGGSAWEQGSAGSAGQNNIDASRLDQSTIRSIQQALNDEGFHAGPVDGQWGPNTQASVRNFQREQGMQQTGQLTPETLDALGVDAQNLGGQNQRQNQDQNQGMDNQPATGR